MVFHLNVVAQYREPILRDNVAVFALSHEPDGRTRALCLAIFADGGGGVHHNVLTEGRAHFSV